jgi:hypothetical protein
MLRTLALVTVALFAFNFIAIADEKKPEPAKEKEVKLEGKLVCGKCKLKETDECSNVLLVKEKDKEIKYYLKDEGKKAAYHVCVGEKDATATGGKLTEKDGKKTLDGAKVEVKK